MYLGQLRRTHCSFLFSSISAVNCALCLLSILMWLPHKMPNSGSLLTLSVTTRQNSTNDCVALTHALHSRHILQISHIPFLWHWARVCPNHLPYRTHQQQHPHGSPHAQMTYLHRIWCRGLICTESDAVDLFQQADRAAAFLSFAAVRSFFLWALVAGANSWGFEDTGLYNTRFSTVLALSLPFLSFFLSFFSLPIGAGSKWIDCRLGKATQLCNVCFWVLECQQT